MSQVTEKSVVSKENYEELKKMLTSNDEASANLALTIVEQSDYDESEIYILCLLKDCFREAFGTVQKFKEQSPILHERVSVRLKTDDVDIAKISFEQVYELAVKLDKQEEIEFLLDIVRDELVSLMKDFGYKFVNFTDIIIRPKGWQGKQEDLVASLQSQIETLKT